MGKLLITGAAGFIGTNCALSLRDDFELILIDNFSRSGSEKNAAMLKDFGLTVLNVDVADRSAVNSTLDKQGDISAILHLAAQTSLLESLKNPIEDFDSNALGTINLLEYFRINNPNCRGIFLSSNKVYGNLNEFDFAQNGKRYVPVGIKPAFGESLPVLPKGGYSISKSISDAYVQEYGKRYSMPVISLRQSAVYGPYQNPRSDQGWVVHFLRELNATNVVQLRGEGLQVRDILFVDDFVELARMILESQPKFGDFFNVGGGVDNSLSILELFELYTDITGTPVSYKTATMDLEDQKYFVSDNQKIREYTGWLPKVSPRDGVSRILKHLSL
jgi:CDP-paratose 2-epimerase